MKAESLLRSEIRAMQEDFARKDFFRVIVLGPQLLVAIVDLLGSYFEEWADRKGLSKFGRDEMRVFELMSKLGKPDSDRLIIAGALASIFEIERQTDPKALENFESSFNKLQALITMRNFLAHEYYSSKKRDGLLKASAAGALDLLARLEKEMRSDDWYNKACGDQ